MTKRAAWGLVLVVLAGTVAACASGPSGVADRAERVWQKQGIASYQIEVLVVNSIWHAQTHIILVRNGEIQEATASCTPAPMELGTCQVRPFNAKDYTVPGLFAEARAQTQGGQAEWVSVTYDPAYGFPDQISFDNPDVVDEDSTWRVTAFKVLE